MPLIKKDVVIKILQGLHARPAGMIVQVVAKYNSKVSLAKDDMKVNAKSMMGILTLGAEQNTTITIEASGEDAQKVINELEALLSMREIQ